MTVEAYVVRKGGCLTYVASRPAHPRGRAVFDGVVHRFHVLHTQLPD